MLPFVVIFVLMCSCSPTSWQVADDIIDGEINTAEKVAEDLKGGDRLQGKKKPAIEIRTPIKRF